MGRTLYTYQGLAKLGELVRNARGTKSGRQFAREMGLSYATITRLEKGEIKEPEVTTLQKLAPHLGYSKEELIAICESAPRAPEVKIYRVAEDALPVIDQLPDSEVAKVAQHIITRLAQPKVSLNGVKGEGVTFHVELMSKEQIADLLRAIADKVEG